MGRMGLPTALQVVLHLVLHLADAQDAGRFRGEIGNDRAALGTTCWYPDYYCSVTENNTQTPYEVTGGPDECYNDCNSNIDCNFFTWFKRRGSEYCYLLTNCGTEYQIRDDRCLERQSCYSGPKNCTTIPSDNAVCAELPTYTSDLTQWQCEDGGPGHIVNGYNGTLKTGTRCLLSCDAWDSKRWIAKPISEKGFLFSTCKADGSWTDVLPNDFKDDVTLLAFPKPDELGVSSYPKPDEQSVTCGCMDHVLVWPPMNYGTKSPFYYNPRDEAGATMECEDEVQNSEVDRLKEFRIKSNNTCRFLCDDYLVATISCSSGQWSGDIGVGFWCYIKPERKNMLQSSPVISMSSTETAPTDFVPNITSIDTGASNCNDGIYKNNMCVSENEANPWLSFMFARRVYISKVSVTNLLKCTAWNDPSTEFYVCPAADMSNEKNNFKDAVAIVGCIPPTADNMILTSGIQLGEKFNSSILGFGKTHVFEGVKPLFGKFVTIQLQANTRISLAEVVLHYWAGPELVNQSLSSNWAADNNSMADKCTGGHVKKSCHNMGAEKNPFIYLEYSHPAWINKICVINRIPCGSPEPTCSGRFKNAVAIVGTIPPPLQPVTDPATDNPKFTNGTRLGEKFKTNDLPAGHTHCFVGEPLWGNVVTIQLHATTIFNLAEVVPHFWAGCATLHKQDNQQGSSVEIMPGDTISCLTDGGYKDWARARSVRVNSGCVLKAWEGCGYSGHEVTFPHSDSTISHANKLNSFKCTCFN